MSNATENMAQSPCPTKQMSFGDAVRYLQGGFDEPIQRAIAGHVQYCNTCQEQLEHFRALRRSGGQLLSAPHIETAPSGDQLTDATLAAYLDGALSDKEHDLVTERIASNYDNYLRFSALKSEIAKPVDASFAPPLAAVERLKVAVPTVSLTEWRTPFEVVIERLTQTFQTLLALRWPAPAMTFAVGAIAMMMLTPGTQTVVAIPGLAVPGANAESAHIRSGLGDDAEEALTVDLVIPVEKKQDVTFAWAPVATAPVELYRVEILAADGQPAMDQIITEKASVTFKASQLQLDEGYKLSVLGSLENGGLMPVAQYTFSLTRK